MENADYFLFAPALPLFISLERKDYLAPSFLMLLRNSSKECGSTSGRICTCVVNL